MGHDAKALITANVKFLHESEYVATAADYFTVRQFVNTFPTTTESESYIHNESSVVVTLDMSGKLDHSMRTSRTLWARPQLTTHSYKALCADT